MSTTLTDLADVSLLGPEDDGYDAARAIWNGAIDRRPALIARPSDAAGVAAAVAHARAEGLELAVRGGGHSVAGHSTTDGGLLLDLGALRRVSVDAAGPLVRCGGGALLADLDRAAQAHGLVVPAGHVSHTGVAGLTLGGGQGWLQRRYGLTIDSLVAAEVVTADGAIVRASLDENADLFWGLRGGGGNFGVVTEFTFRAHPLGTTVLAGMLVAPLEESARVLREARDLLADAPDALTLFAAFVTLPPDPALPPALRGAKALALVPVWSGEPEAGERALAPLRAVRGIVLDSVGAMPYLALQTMLDPSVPHGRHVYATGRHLTSLDDGLIEALVEAHAASASPHSHLLVGWLGGAIARVDADATAYRHRDAAFVLWIIAAWEPGDGAAHEAWARSLFAATAPYADGGVYVNALADEGPERVREAYGASWERLREVKRRWDPENVFRLNQNVAP